MVVAVGSIGSDDTELKYDAGVKSCGDDVRCRNN